MKEKRKTQIGRLIVPRGDRISFSRLEDLLKIGEICELGFDGVCSHLTQVAVLGYTTKYGKNLVVGDLERYDPFDKERVIGYLLKEGDFEINQEQPKKLILWNGSMGKDWVPIHSVDSEEDVYQIMETSYRSWRK